MQGLDSISHLIRQSGKTIDVPHMSRNLYSILQQEVDLGGQALERESADMAVTLFLNALPKFNVEPTFFEHIVYKPLFNYKLLIEKIKKEGDTSPRLPFSCAGLR